MKRAWSAQSTSSGPGRGRGRHLFAVVLGIVAVSLIAGCGGGGSSGQIALSERTHGIFSDLPRNRAELTSSSDQNGVFPPETTAEASGSSFEGEFGLTPPSDDVPENLGGDVVTCADGTLSFPGGAQGPCYGHGGIEP